MASRARGALGRVVNADPANVEEQCEAVPAIEPVAECFGEIAFARDLARRSSALGPCVESASLQRRRRPARRTSFPISQRWLGLSEQCWGLAKWISA